MPPGETHTYKPVFVLILHLIELTKPYNTDVNKSKWSYCGAQVLLLYDRRYSF